MLNVFTLAQGRLVQQEIASPDMLAGVNTLSIRFSGALSLRASPALYDRPWRVSSGGIEGGIADRLTPKPAWSGRSPRVTGVQHIAP